MLKIYNSGQSFLTENRDILAKYPLETVFFEVNAKLIKHVDSNDFIIKLQDGDNILLAVHYADYPMPIFGDSCLCPQFAKFAYNSGLMFNKVIGKLDTCKTFLNEYVKLCGYEYEIKLSMDIMRCSAPITEDTFGVERAVLDDVDELTALYTSFLSEAMMDESGSANEYRQNIASEFANYAIIRKDGKIVSVACKKRETDALACISDVYTLPQYRCQGLSCKIVTMLTKEITESGKLAYLFVDKTNPVSNHLYTKIGYTYAIPQYEIKIKRNVNNKVD